MILLLTDDQRYDALGAVGDSFARTPNLDRLASQGIVFANAFCTTSICPTSRASFLTGQLGRRHGVEDFSTPLSEAQLGASWHGVLSERGYRSAFVGKWGLGGHLPAERYDFWRAFAGQGRYLRRGGKKRPIDPPDRADYLSAASGRHLTARLADDAVQFVQSTDEPFFLQISFKAPHAQDEDPVPFPAAPRFASLYWGLPIPEPPASASEFDNLPSFLKGSEGRSRWEQRFGTPRLREQSIRGYYGLIAGVDDGVGRLLDALERRGLLSRTVILFSSDNGLLFGEHGLSGKWLPYEESMRIPLIVYDPRLPEERTGAVLQQLVLNIDVAPTILDLAGTETPRSMQGASLRPLLLGRGTPWRDEWFYEYRHANPRIPASEAVRTERWKLVRYLLPESPYEQLFDLREDPFELENLASGSEQTRKLTEMRARLERLAAAAR